MTIQFEITHGEGVFLYPEDAWDVQQKLGEILDKRDMGQLSAKASVALLDQLISEAPWFVDGHAHLGFTLLEDGKTKKALEALLKGIAIAEKALPEGYTGTAMWGFLENRPYLRALHGAAFCYLQLRQRKKAVPFLEKILQYNPDDNQGVRYMLGSEYLRTGETKKALEIFKTEAEHYPPYHYERGLLHLMDSNWVEAATSLRRGGVANGYIAEMLLGNPAPRPRPIWHSDNFAEADYAGEYVSRHGDLWERNPFAIKFLNWLYHHSDVLTERAKIVACQEELLWERDVEKRKALIERENEATAKIDDTLSKCIIKRREDRNGRTIFPWDYKPFSPMQYFS